MRTIVLLLFIFLFTSQLFSQTQKTVDSLQREEQICLDKGLYMRGCVLRFYAQMDSLLNAVYDRLYHSLDTANRVKLKKEQKRWLVKRDTIFELTVQKIHAGAVKEGFAGGQDEGMFIADQKAAIVKKRVSELMRRLKK